MAGRRSYHTKAVVLDTTKLAEQDLILTMLGETGVQVRAVAKGARKPGGRLAARSELFCESDFLLVVGRSLDVVSEASVIDAHATMRGDLDRVSAASAICEVARLTCYEDAQDPFLFPICSRALTACEQAADLDHLRVVVAAYVFKVLAHGGWRPELDGCVACGDEDVSWFSAHAGGVLCESCVRDVPGAVRLVPGELDWLRALIGLTFDQLLASEPDERIARRLATHAKAWAETQLDVRLRGLEFLMGL